MKRFIKILSLPVVIVITMACGWDWDTIQMEKQQFPQIHELIVGKFYRHSPELYYWRIKHRSDLIKKYPDSLSLYDDLAMAYDKTGESMKAVNIMLKKEKKKAGLYETYANLGLFYMHANDIKKGVEFVKKALVVNPNAHFGREKYQLHLGNYILQRMQGDSLSLPLMRGEKTGFYSYLVKHEFKHKDYKSEDHFNELSNAIKGVAGMMTFANHRSPVLLEVLADLLLHTKSVRGAGHLASRSLLKASIETEGKTAELYYAKAKWAREYNYYPNDERIYKKEFLENIANRNPEKVDTISGQITEVPVISMDRLVVALKLEIQSAEKWFDSIRNDEMNWIKTGKNPDNEFATKYYHNSENNLKQIIMENSRVTQDNAIWLQLQLTRPQNIMNIHGFNALDDSTKKIIDSIYEIEFAENVLVEQPTKKSKKDKSENTNSGTPFYIWILVFMPVFGAFVYFKFIKRKQ